MKRIIIFGITAIAFLQINAQNSATSQTSNHNVSVTHSDVIVSNEVNNSPTSIDLLVGFPKMSNTGNAALDIENYKIAKEKWISENQDLYNKYLESMKNNQASVNSESNSNQSIDKATKEQWIKDNPQKYNGSNQSK